jgi:RNA polymerase sigma-70 factor (ECF subfamily)
MTTAAMVTEAAATTDSSHSPLALVGADPARWSAPARAGDAKAVGREIGRLFSEHGRLVFALCNILLRDRDEAEDATQQCFLSAQKSMLAGTVPADAAAWLAAIARNECLSRLRRRRPPTVALRDDDLLTDTDVADLVDRRTEIAALSEAIAGLPPAQRQAVILRDFYGLSYREVSVALGVTGPAVESLLFKSRKRLQERLRPFRASSGIAAVPAAIRETLTRAIPGFSSGLPRTGPGAIGSGLTAKLLSGHAAAKLAVIALAAGAGTVALTHETLFRGTPKAAPLIAGTSRSSPGPDLELASPTRPPDAVASPLRVPHTARPAPRTRTTSTFVAPAPKVELHPATRKPPTRASSASELPKKGSRTAATPQPVLPAPVVSEAANPVARTSPPAISAPRTPPIPVAPTVTTPAPTDSHDGAGGGSDAHGPSVSPSPDTSGPVPTATGQGTSGTVGSGPGEPTPSVGGSDDGHDQTTTVTTTTSQPTTTNDGDSGRHHDGGGSSPQSESNDGPGTTTTPTTTTATTATTAPATTTAATTTTTDG